MSRGLRVDVHEAERVAVSDMVQLRVWRVSSSLLWRLTVFYLVCLGPDMLLMRQMNLVNNFQQGSISHVVSKVDRWILKGAPHPCFVPCHVSRSHGDMR